MNKEKIRIIAFDADDTLWHHEIYFYNAIEDFCHFFPFIDKDRIKKELLKTVKNNISLYGYGIKSFTLSMLETYINFSSNSIEIKVTNKIINIGKSMIKKPIDLIEGVEHTIKVLSDKYCLMVITKGDLLDQERKIKNSKIFGFFKNFIVVSEKNEQTYLNVLEKNKIEINEFLMVGNSIKSDILPVLNIGAKAIHIPYKITWEHEDIKLDKIPKNYLKIDSILSLLPMLND